ncbi:MAG: cyclic lactone autoinducer peptide [Halanaerobiaceae bacterium]
MKKLLFSLVSKMIFHAAEIGESSTSAVYFYQPDPPKKVRL